MSRSRKPVVQNSGYLTWEQATAKFIPWALSAMVAYATYNLHKLTDSVTILNTQITKIVTVTGHHEYRLDQQLARIKNVEEENKVQGEDIAVLKVKNNIQ